MLQERQGVSDVVPLPLTITTAESGGQLICELLGMLVLEIFSESHSKDD